MCKRTARTTNGASVVSDGIHVNSSLVTTLCMYIEQPIVTSLRIGMFWESNTGVAVTCTGNGDMTYIAARLRFLVGSLMVVHV
jgi:hypothetical protein